MTAAREHILSRLRAGAAAAVPARGERVAPLLRNDRVEAFIARARAAAAEIVEVRAFVDVPAALAAHLGPCRLRHADDETIAALPWSEAPTLDLLGLPLTPDDRVSLTLADAGVAETGSIVQRAAAHSPTLLAFLPETHVALMPASRIADGIDQALARLHADGTPTTINFITGPSRTGDIEQTIELGAHGPRRLVVVVVHEA